MCEVGLSLGFLPFAKKVLWDLDIKHAYTSQTTL